MTDEQPEYEGVAAKQRFLLGVIEELAYTLTNTFLYQEVQKQNDEPVGPPMAYIEFVSSDDPIKPGDLVFCATSGYPRPHRCQIGVVVEVYSRSHCLLREIGSDYLVEVSNEMFKRLVGFEQLLDRFDIEYHHENDKPQEDNNESTQPEHESERD